MKMAQTTVADIHTLTAEFARLDRDAAEGYVAHDGNEDRWPTVGFEHGKGAGHGVIRVHPEDMGKAVEALRTFADGAANVSGPESYSYDPVKALATAGVRCEWLV